MSKRAKLVQQAMIFSQYRMEAGATKKQVLNDIKIIARNCRTKKDAIKVFKAMNQVSKINRIIEGEHGKSKTKAKSKK